MEQEDPPVKAGVILQSLVTHKDARKLAGYVYRMLTSVGVISTDILSIAVDKRQGVALVRLRTNDAEEFILKVFADIRNVLNFFDVRKLCARPKNLNVSRQIFGEGHYSNSMQPGESTQIIVVAPVDAPQHSADYITNNLEGPSQPQVPANEMGSFSSTSSCKPNGFEPLIEENDTVVDKLSVSTSTEEKDTGVDRLSVSTSMSELPPQEECEATSDVIKLDVKTSTPQCSPCFCPQTVFYHKKQHVGSESRHAEFKRGGIITDLRSFRSLVGKYLSAFLNTEGGTLYFGVTDDGMALGINVNQRTEDQIRLAIDNAVTMIKPHVPTTAYSVNFAKIMNENGEIEENLRLLEICVKPCATPQTKHSFDNNVYVRRDGSLRTVDNDIDSPHRKRQQ